MLKLGFHEDWVRLIVACVTTASYSIMVNGEPKGYVRPQCGLRQGDPLSPYLFLLCAKGLSALFWKAKRDSLIRGISISQGGPRISHLFFADDSIVFCKAINANCAELQQLLSVYANVSGQVVNTQKTVIFFFSYNTSQTCRDSICSILGTNPTKQF